jgi:hypothetical protein
MRIITSSYKTTTYYRNLEDGNLDNKTLGPPKLEVEQDEVIILMLNPQLGGPRVLLSRFPSS